MFEQIEVIGSYSADVNLLYPPTHTLTKDNDNTGDFIPYSSRLMYGFFNVPQGTYIMNIEDICETGPTVYSPYLRRLTGVITKATLSPPLF